MVKKEIFVFDTNRMSTACPPILLPSLVGVAGASAKAQIEAATSNVTVHVLPEDAMVTMDYRLDRVRVYVDATGIVTKEPKRG